MAFTIREITHAIVLCLTALVFALPNQLEGATSDWLAAPKPKFPSAALKKGSEGSVKLRVVLNSDGRVKESKVTKSSGDPVLDQAAQNAVLRWKMKPSAIKGLDLTKGRETIVEFKQEALLAAVYPDRKAYWASWEKTDNWMYAPFPSYPLDERRLHHTGKVILFGRIDGDGRVSSVKVLQSSGHGVLDQCAVDAVRLWRAHKRFAGQEFKVPVDFVIGGRHY